MKQMIKTQKFRIYPTKSQKRQLLSTLDLCRNLYNGALQERNSFYHLFKKSRSYKQQQNTLPEIKSILPEYKNVHSQVLQDVLKRLDKAFSSFFRRIKNNEETPGFPRFKGKNRYNSFTFSQSGFSIVENKLNLSKIGLIKVKLHTPISENIKTCTITKTPTNKWFVCFSYEVEKQTSISTNNIIGLDLGLTNFITDSNNNIIKPEKFLNKHLEKLAKRSRKFSKNKNKKKNEQNRLSVARTHEKVKNCRNDWQHKIANQIIKNNDIIVVEDLNIKGMLENKENKVIKPKKRNINDVSWGLFVEKLKYKAEYAGKKLIQVDPTNTSKMCSSCNNIKESLKLEEREYKCDNCYICIVRDYNAAINILIRGMQNVFLEGELE
jgi:putative transposase